MRNSFLSVAYKGWQYAGQSYSNESTRYRLRQQWKIFFRSLISPQFAAKWFASLQSPSYSLVARHRKRLYIKPFRAFMSNDWTKDQKTKVILDTYRFIQSQGKPFLSVITNNQGLEIVRFKLTEEIEGNLTLGYDDQYRTEGELVLSFSSDQIEGIIACAAFSFEEVLTGKWVCRIGCVQGHRRNDLYASKVAQKLLHGFRPKAFIVFMVQEFVRQLGFSAVYGVGDAIHSYRGKHAVHLPWLHGINFDYDEFWLESGGVLTDDGWYQLPLTPVRKNMQDIKTHKRAYYNRRYALCDTISGEMAKTVTRMS